jgi:paraquat-inducible protein B
MHRVNDADADQAKPRDLPRPKLARMRWPFPLIWLVPICAAAGAGYYWHLHNLERGTEITVQFKDVSGLKPTQTPVTIHGVEIGRVTSLELGEDRQRALVHIALERKYASVATEGALFWIVQPDFSNGTITGLGTIVSGPYIEAVPGVGAAESQFVGLEKQPVSLGEGLILILQADHLEHLQPDSPILYRGVQVGVVQSAHLASDAAHVNINVVIWERFARLVTKRTEFWSVSGADVRGGIFSGISVKLDSLSTLLSGGVAFATPEEDSNQPAQDGANFTLHDDPKKDWLTWAPKIPLPPEAVSRPDVSPDQHGNNSVGSALNGKF